MRECADETESAESHKLLIRLIRVYVFFWSSVQLLLSLCRLAARLEGLVLRIIDLQHVFQLRDLQQVANLL